MSDLSEEIFSIKARKCLRCGRLLTSQDAIRDGYGCRCKELAEAAKRAAEPTPGQIDIFDWLGGNKDGRSNNN